MDKLAEQSIYRIMQSRPELAAITTTLGLSAMEEAIVGAVLRDNRLYDDLHMLTEADFTDLPSAVAWLAINRLITGKKSADEMTTAEEMTRVTSQWDYETALTLTATMLAHAAQADDLQQYVNSVLECSVRLRGVAAAYDNIERLNDMTTPLLDALAQSDSAWYSATEQRGVADTSATAVKDALRNTIGNDTYMLSGWQSFDKLAGGFATGKVTLWCGITGDGKTTSLLDVVLHVLSRGGSVNMFLGDSQPGVDVMRKLLAKIIGKAPDALKAADFTPAIDEVVEKWNLHLIDDIPLTPASITRRQRLLQRDRPCDLMVIEGLYEMSSDTMSAGLDLALHWPDVIKQMIAFAAGKNYPVILSHQFRDSTGTREDKTPTIDDLRGHSGLKWSVQYIYALTRKQDQGDHAYIWCLKNRSRDINGRKITLYRDTANHRYTEPGVIVPF